MTKIQNLISDIKTLLDVYPQEFKPITDSIKLCLDKLAVRHCMPKKHLHVYGQLANGQEYVKYSYVVDIFKNSLGLECYNGKVGKLEEFKQFVKYLDDSGVNVCYKSVPGEDGVSLVCLADKNLIDILINDYISNYLGKDA